MTPKSELIQLPPTMRERRAEARAALLEVLADHDDALGALENGKGDLARQRAGQGTDRMTAHHDHGPR